MTEVRRRWGDMDLIADKIKIRGLSGLVIWLRWQTTGYPKPFFLNEWYEVARRSRSEWRALYQGKVESYQKEVQAA